MKIQNPGRSELRKACKELDKRATETPMDVILASPYLEADQERQRLVNWGSPSAVEPFARSIIQAKDRELLQSLKHLRSENGPDMLSEASRSTAARVQKIAHNVAVTGGTVAAVVGLPLTAVGALNILAGAFNVLAWPAHATGPGWLPGTGIGYAVAGAGLATFVIGAMVGEAAENRVKGYAELPKQYEAWQQFLTPKS